MTDTMQGLNKEQLDAVQTINGPMLILAGAGSGKTKVLTCRIAHLLQQGVRPYRFWQNYPLPIKPPRKCASV